MIKKGNRYYNELFPEVIYIEVDDDNQIPPELPILTELAILCIKENVQTEHANNKNIGELCKFLKEFTEEVAVKFDLPACIKSYKPIVIKPKAKSKRTRQKNFNEVKDSLFK